MSITALTIINRAMRLIQVLGTDQTPTANDAADGLYALNAMLDAWSIERLMVYHILQQDFAWTVNQASMTIGSGGDFDVSRPTKVVEQGNFLRDGNNNIDYPLIWLGDWDSYQRILLKSSTSSYPQWLYVDTGYPLMTLYLWPVPTMSLTLYLGSWQPLQTFVSLNEAIELPNGYQRAIEYNLALEIAPEYGTAAVVSPRVEKVAATSKMVIKSINRPDLVARLDPAIFGRGQPYNIYSDSGPITGT